MNDTINRLTRFMLSEENMSQFAADLMRDFASKDKEAAVIERTTGKDAPKKGNLLSEAGTYMPYQKDKLFWCLYAILEGVAACEAARQKSFKTEMAAKFALIPALREQADAIAAAGLKLAEVEVDLASNRSITLVSFRALCAAKGLRVVYNDNRVFTRCGPPGDPQFIVSTSAKGETLILKDVKDRVEHMSNTLYEITDFKKPIMAISRYTAPEVQDICRRLELPLADAAGKKLAKRALYDMASAQILVLTTQT